MATQVIPTLTDGTQNYTETILLGGSNFVLNFSWNPRESAWHMLISDSSLNQLLSTKITVGTPLTYRFADLRLPAGEFFAIDTSNQDLDPGLRDFGSRVLLHFTDLADLQALVA